MRRAELRKKIVPNLCDDAMPEIRRGAKPNAVACAECVSMCIYGMRYLEELEDSDFEALRCGGDCEKCICPCNLRKADLIRKKNCEKVVEHE